MDTFLSQIVKFLADKLCVDLSSASLQDDIFPLNVGWKSLVITRIVNVGLGASVCVILLNFCGFLVEQKHSMNQNVFWNESDIFLCDNWWWDHLEILISPNYDIPLTSHVSTLSGLPVPFPGLISTTTSCSVLSYNRERFECVRFDKEAHQTGAIIIDLIHDVVSFDSDSLGFDVGSDKGESLICFKLQEAFVGSDFRALYF